MVARAICTGSPAQMGFKKLKLNPVNRQVLHVVCDCKVHQGALYPVHNGR